MRLIYYNHKELAYTNRKRYSRNSFLEKFGSPHVEPEYEIQLKLLLNDGINAQIKTNKIPKEAWTYIVMYDENVPTENSVYSRWYVVSYEYLNGKQMILFLQRDVIGETSLEGFFGTIERGFTSSLLRNKKELSVNQILKDRVPIHQYNETVSTSGGNTVVTKTYKSGNADITYKNNELWGILYITKPADTSTSINVDIPAFAPNSVNLPLIDNGSLGVATLGNQNISLEFILRIGRVLEPNKFTRKCVINFWYDENNNLQHDISVWYKDSADYPTCTFFSGEHSIFTNEEEADGAARLYCENLVSQLTSGKIEGWTFPTKPTGGTTSSAYDGAVIKDGTLYRKYYKNVVSVSTVGLYDKSKFSGLQDDKDFVIHNNIQAFAYSYSYETISGEEAGKLNIPVSSDYIDEPYTILVVPLCDCSIKAGAKDYIIKSSTSFNVFNSVIEALSGENGYLVDAQIYPYCPILSSVSVEFKGIPFFTSLSTFFEFEKTLNLFGDDDVKKNYIKNLYSIVSPDQTGRFDFDLYDYSNNKTISFKVKTALKPFSIISAVVPIPQSGTLKNLTYDSDMRGCCPSSNGFECSMSSNAFETYRRQNSNYQQIFALQQGELSKQHEVERTNEKTQAIVNTITATMMGAVGGYSIGGGGIGGAIGAGIGGTAAGAVVGSAQAIQYQKNQELREYEEWLQKQMFSLNIGTVKNLPNSINRISSFNEIILKNFFFVVEVYTCSEIESETVDTFIKKCGYSLDVCGYFRDFYKTGWFLKGRLIESALPALQHKIAAKELSGGIYYYDTV